MNEPELQIGFLGDPRLDGALAGLTYMQIIDAVGGSQIGNSTDAVLSFWQALRDFEPFGGSVGFISQADDEQPCMAISGRCLGSLLQEGDIAIVDDRAPIRAGDVVAFLYAAGFYCQGKIYLGRWTDAAWPFENRKPAFMHALYQLHPPILCLVPDEDLVAAIRVTKTIDAAGVETVLDPWRPEDGSELAAIVADHLTAEQIEPTKIDEWNAIAEQERINCTHWLFYRMTTDDLERFYIKYPGTRPQRKAA